MKFSIIAAVDEKMGIGIRNGLPWRLPADLKYFSDVTTGADEGKVNAVIMGLNTWNSLPKAHRPLKGRFNIVLCREDVSLDGGEMAVVAHSIDEALEKANALPNIGSAFVIGGASIYAQAIERPECERLYLTEVQGEFECDTFFPTVDLEKFQRVNESDVIEDGGVKIRFVEYEVN